VGSNKVGNADSDESSGSSIVGMEDVLDMAKLDHTRRVLRYELTGLLFLVIGIVTLGDFGAAGEALDDLCITLAGNWHFLIPLYVIWVALHVMFRRHRFHYSQVQVGILILLFVVLTWSEMSLYSLAVSSYDTGSVNLLGLTRSGIDSLNQSLTVSVLNQGRVLPVGDAGGGMIGYAVFAGLKYLVAVTGTVLVLIAATLAAAVLITRKSLVGTIERGSHYFEQRLDRGWARAMKGLARVLSGPAQRHRDEAKEGVKTRARRAKRGPDEDAGLVAPVDFNGAEADAALTDAGAGGKRAGRVKKTKKSKGVAALTLGGDAEDDSDHDREAFGLNGSQRSAFPFPDFGIPYGTEPPYEDFLTQGKEREPDITIQGEFELDRFDEHDLAPVGSVDGLDDGVVTFDPSSGRMTLQRPAVSVPGLAPDPMTRRSADSNSGGPSAALPGVTLPAAPVTRPYRMPDARLLDRGAGRKGDSAAMQKELQAGVRKLAETFASFGVEVKVLGYSRGPAVTRYEIQPAVGVKVSRILSLSDDLALALAARDIRIEAPIPGKSAIGIEVPNKEIAVVHFREVLETEAYTNAPGTLSIALGKDIAGNTIIADLARMPHVLVAGSTGSGKSVCINGIIASILFRARPDQVKFILIDPKMVELGVYNGIPHLFAPVVTEARRAAAALRKVIAEMEQRYELFSKAKVRDLERYNAFAVANGKPALPLIVVIIDELADLMMVAPGDVENAICRLAQMARASGIHLVVATQRPSVDVITGLIKANIPSRIAFAVSSGVDSRTILDGSGAEKLLGRGDMLYMPVGAAKPLRLQGAYLSEPEVEKLVEYVSNQQEAQYIDDFSSLTEDSADAPDDLDPLFEDAVKLVVESEQASTSFLQRKLKVGYARAARLVDSLEQMGIVGPFDNSKPREVYMTREQWLERQSQLG